VNALVNTFVRIFVRGRKKARTRRAVVWISWGLLRARPAPLHVAAGLLAVVIDRQPLQVVHLVTATAHKGVHVVDFKAWAWSLVLPGDGAGVQAAEFGLDFTLVSALHSRM